MQIRKCRQSDMTRAGAFYDYVVKWLDGHVNYPEWIYRVYPSEAFVEERTKEESLFLCVEEETDRIIGAFALGADPMENEKNAKWQQDLPEGTFLIVHALAVDPQYQGQGIGAEAVRFSEEYAKSEGYRALRSEIVLPNIPARKLFEKMGFLYADEIEQEVGPGIVKRFRLYERNW